MKKDCPYRDKTFIKQENVALAEKCYDSAEALTVSQGESTKTWVLDIGCTYHMTPHKEWLQNLNLDDGGSVLLGNDKAYKVKDICNIHLKLHD